MSGKVFVTVGSTKFDDLINIAQDESFQSILANLDYRHLIIQFGSSSISLPTSLTRTYPSNTHLASSGSSSIQIDTYDYKKNIIEDMKNASLLISHAGAGTLLEGMRLNKNIIAVINDTLMNDHQKELADVLSTQGYIISSTCSELIPLLMEFYTDKNNSSLQKYFERRITYPAANSSPFYRLLDEEMGFIPIAD